jgi:chromosome segregation ATPase
MKHKGSAVAPNDGTPKQTNENEAKLTAEIQQLKLENKGLSDQLTVRENELQEAKQLAQTTQAQFDELSKSLKEKKEPVPEVKGDIAAATDNVAEAEKNKTEELETLVQQLHSDNKGLRVAVDQLQTELKAKTKEYEQTLLDKAALEDKLEKQTTPLEQQSPENDKKSSELLTTSPSTTSSLEILEEKVRHLTAENELLNEQILLLSDTPPPPGEEVQVIKKEVVEGQSSAPTSPPEKVKGTTKPPAKNTAPGFDDELKKKLDEKKRKQEAAAKFQLEKAASK